ncbi:ATP-binding protein [Petrocella sp. FN5]|uniref:ATP-binding protein n=1 Tax=Petrocella sp. FN5 TaxID=3032002 RepID=UPI0023DB91EA|nr:ATP-binding protein [Petrocella sp. FN5]MDF1616442.1 ATP-binding protein [Petrocella sp. FN5]
MSISIRWRLVLMYVLMVVIVMMVSGTMIVLLVRSNEMESVQESIQLAVEAIKTTAFEDVNIDDIEDVKLKLSDVYEKYAALYKGKRVFLLDRTSRVVLPLSDAEKGLSFPTHQVMGAIEDGQPYEMYDKNRRLPGDDRKYIGYAENIKDSNGRVVYVVYVLGETTSVTNSIEKTIMVIISAAAVAILIAVVLGFIFSDFLTKPITALTVKARDMARGHLDKPIKVYANDEIGQLTKNFNRMAKSLNETLNEITSEKNKLEIVFKHMTDGILVFDKVGVMIHSNPASIDMLKLDKQISFQEVFNPYLEVSYNELKNMVQEETILHVVIVEHRYYSVYFAKFLDQHNEAVGLICVIQDITEHKKLEEMQKEFVANVSHELRTPLTTIKSYTETLLEGTLEDTEIATRFLNVINHESDRMTALVQDLLELSKLDNKQIKFAMNDINLESILEDSINKYRIHSEKKNQSLIYHKPNNGYRTIGDVNRIEQVIKNIISNAVKYSPEGAIIEIDMEDQNKYIKVSVADNGLGISKDDLKRIFERFYRVDKARSREMGGTGLGLAIAKEIMEYHGGKILVDSEVGVGTTFELYFLKKQA